MSLYCVGLLGKSSTFTYDEEKELTSEGITINVYPVWKWCLEDIGKVTLLGGTIPRN